MCENNRAESLKSTDSHIYFVLPLVFVLWIGLLTPIRLLDFWWHLKIGELILEQKSIPTTDLFSFTESGKPFVHQNWLAAILFRFAYVLGDFSGLVFLNTLLLVFASTTVLCHGRKAIELVTGEESNRYLLILACYLVLILAIYSSLRTQTFSFAAFVWFAFVLWRNRSSSTQKLWCLPLIMVVWVNVHGAYIFGIGLIGITLVGRFLETRQLTSELRRLAICLALAIAAIMINPLGLGVVRLLFEMQTNAPSQQYVTEWQPPVPTNRLGWIIFYGPFVAVVSIVIANWRRTRATDLLLLFAFAAFALRSRRHGVWFTLVALPIIAAYGAMIIQSWANRVRDIRAPAASSSGSDSARYNLTSDGGKVSKLPADTSELAPSRLANLFPAVIAIILIGFTVIILPPIRSRLLPSIPLVERSTPVGAADYLEAENITGRIFHPQSYGSYLIWRLWPQQRTFFDDRVHLFSSELVNDYRHLFRDPNWQARLAKYKIEYLLLDRHSDDCQALLEQVKWSGNWIEVYRDENSIMFAKANVPSSPAHRRIN